MFNRKEDGFMNLNCVKCQSERIASRNLARKTGGTLGTVAGMASGAAGALRVASTG